MTITTTTTAAKTPAITAIASSQPTAGGVTGLSWAGTTARRMHRQGLATPAPEATPAEVVAAMCGAQAQVMTAAELSVALRLAGGTQAAVREAVDVDRSLVKTFGPRGTIHLLPTADLPMWTGALSALPAPNRQPPGIRLAPEQADQVVAAIADALSDTELTVDELSDAVVAATGPWAHDPVIPAFQGAWPRWRQVMATAAYRGVLCFAGKRGRKVTYTNPHRWLPGFRPDDSEVAAADLALRYLHAYGPATAAHFAQWLAAPRGWAKEVYSALGDRLEPVALQGTSAWVVAGDTAPAPKPAPGVRLLPYFDAFAIGCHPRGLLFPGAAADRALARGQAGNYPVVLVEGVVGGVWHLRRSGNKAQVTVEPLPDLAPARRRTLDDRLDHEVARLGEALGLNPTLTVGPVTTGPHA